LDQQAVHTSGCQASNLCTLFSLLLLLLLLL
jgi:hypothetical protein